MIPNAHSDTIQFLDAEYGQSKKGKATIEDVNRVLEVGRILFSVLTEEEIEELQRILNGSSDQTELGNAGVT